MQVRDARVSPGAGKVRTGHSRARHTPAGAPSPLGKGDSLLSDKGQFALGYINIFKYILNTLYSCIVCI